MTHFSTGYYSGSQGTMDWYMNRATRVQIVAGLVGVAVIVAAAIIVILGLFRYTDIRQNTYGVGAEQHAPTVIGLDN